MVLERLYKSKFQNSVQLQIVLTLCDQETVRNNGQTSYLRLKTSVQLHIDQMMRNRNFRVWNEVVERGSVTKSQRKPTLWGKWESVFSGKAHGQCFKGDSCSLSHDKTASGNSGSGQTRKGRSSSPAPNSKAKTDGEGGNRDGSSNKRSQILCRYKNCQKKKVM